MCPQRRDISVGALFIARSFCTRVFPGTSGTFSEASRPAAACNASPAVGVAHPSEKTLPIRRNYLFWCVAFAPQCRQK
jgi:hypothetical protein